MENFYIDIDPVSYALNALITLGAVGLFLAAVSTVITVLIYRDRRVKQRHVSGDDSAVPVAWVVSFIALIFVLIFVPMGWKGSEDEANEALQQTALEEHFQNVSLSGGDFTASDQGDYVSGSVLGRGYGHYLVAINP